MLKDLFCLLIAALLALSACSPDTQNQSDDEGDPAPIVIPPVANNLRYASTVDPSQKAALDESISALYLLPIDNADPKLMRMMKISDFKPATLQTWIEDRVQYIVGGGFKYEQARFNGSKMGFSFPQPGVLPDANRDGAENQEDESDVVMANVGAGVYMDGKERSQLYGLNIPGIGRILLTSPRVGVLQIGPGLFPRGIVGAGNIAIDIFRAGTLFHEARHSDGNGKSLAFAHAKCPIDHDYADRYACDYPSNGAYTVGALMIKALKDHCAPCTQRQHRALDAIYLDQSSRVLSGYVYIPSHKPSYFRAQPKDWDDTPEGSR